MSARLTVEQRQLRLVTEAAWQTTVQQLASLAGWKHFHAPDNMPRTSRRGTVYVQNVRAGYPDLTLVKGDRLIFAELKRETGKPSPEQVDWLAALAAVPGVETYLWRPSDRDQVMAVLGLKQPAW